MDHLLKLSCYGPFTEIVLLLCCQIETLEHRYTCACEFVCLIDQYRYDQLRLVVLSPPLILPLSIVASSIVILIDCFIPWVTIFRTGYSYIQEMSCIMGEVLLLAITFLSMDLEYQWECIVLSSEGHWLIGCMFEDTTQFSTHSFTVNFMW